MQDFNKMGGALRSEDRSRPKASLAIAELQAGRLWMRSICLAHKRSHVIRSIVCLH